MSKIGIMTFLHNDNFGSALQAYALQRTMRELGHDCVHLDYQPDRAEKIRNLLTSGNSPKLVLEGIRKREVRAGQDGAQRKSEAIPAFYRKRMKLTAPCRNRKELREKSRDCDLLLCGSDQIWNPVWLNPAYFLTFAEKGQTKAAYAASLGVSQLPKSAKVRKIRQWTKDFSVISGFFQGGVKQGPQNYFSAKENGEFYNVYVNDVARDGNYEYSALHGKIVDLKEKSQFVYTFRLDDRALENSPGTKGAESILKTEKTVTYIDNPLDVSGELTLYRKGIRPSQLPKAVKDKYQWDTKDYSDSPLNHSVIYYKDEKIEIYMFGRENNQYGYWK